MYLRFVRPLRAPGLKARAGFFDAAYELCEFTRLDPASADRLEEHLAWFRTNLPIPKTFTRSKSKGSADREATPGLSWFKPEAKEPLAHAFDLVSLLRDFGYPIDILRTDRVGYVIYEDKLQLVAEPFADTPV